MKFSGWSNTQSLAVKQQGEFAVYVSSTLDWTSPRDDTVWEYVRQEVVKICETELAAIEVMGDILEGGLFFFPSEQKAREFYAIFEQELTDSSGIYAALYANDGRCLTENT